MEKEEENKFLDNKQPQQNGNVGFRSGKEGGGGGGGCCTLKCTLISCGVMVVLVLLIVGGGAIWYNIRINSSGITSENSEEWERKIMSQSNNESQEENSPLSGKYRLVSFDENYSKYLTAMGIPGFVVSLILGSSETIEVKTPPPNRLDEGKWTLHTINDMRENVLEFKLDEEFQVEFRKGIVTHSICRLTSNSTLFCENENRERGTKSSWEYFFTGVGLINTRRLLGSKDITAKKFYERIDESELLATSPSPFSDDDDDFEDWDDWDDWD